MTISTELGAKPAKFIAEKVSKIAGPGNRFILGISALASQPFFDYYNKNVDEKTRKYSTCKTISKIVVGTTVGVIVRALTIKYSGKLLNHIDLTKIASDALTNKETKELIQKSIGDILGLVVCLFTNFLIDAPLTKKCTNFLFKHFAKEEK